MALVTCPDCQNQVSSEAWICPKCGRPIKRVWLLSGKRPLILWAILIVMFIVIWFMLPNEHR